MRNLPPGSGDDDGMPGPLIRARVGRPHPRALQEPRHALPPPALDALPRRPLQAELRRRLRARASRAATATSSPGRTWTYRLTALAGSVGAWPYHDHSPSMHESIDGGMWGMLSIRGRRERLPDREFVVVFAPIGPLPGHRRPRVRRQHAGVHRLPGQLVQWDVMAMGSEHHTFHVHGHRWREHGVAGRHEDRRPGGELPHPLARARPRDLALPLPRRDPHGAGHDRHLPGAAPMRRALIAAVAALALAPGRRRRRSTITAAAPGGAEISIGYAAFDPPFVDVLRGDTVRWANVSARRHDVAAVDGSVRLRRARRAGRRSRARSRGRATSPTSARSTRSCAAPSACTSCCSTRPREPAVPGRPFPLRGRTALAAGHADHDRGRRGRAASCPVGATAAQDDGDVRRRRCARAPPAQLRAVVGRRGQPARAAAGARPRASPPRAHAPRAAAASCACSVTPPGHGGTVVLQLRLRERFGWWPVRHAELDHHGHATLQLRTPRRVRARVVLTLADGATPLAVSRAAATRPPDDAPSRRCGPGCR